MQDIWYKKPATNWEEALPIGNGYMGAMCFGGTVVEKLQLNADSLWYGGFKDRINPDAQEYIPTIRRLISEGRIKEAERLANETMAAVPDTQCHYEMLADMFLIPDGEEDISIFGLKDGWSPQITAMGKCVNYTRGLDLDNAIHTVLYDKKCDNDAGELQMKKCERRTFISYPDKVGVILNRGVAGRLFFERGAYFGEIEYLGNDTLVMTGQAGANGVCYALAIKVVKGSRGRKGRTLYYGDDSLILFASQTSFYSDNYKEEALAFINEAEKYSYDELEMRHKVDVNEYMRRCSFELEGEDRNSIPTDERVKALRDGGEDLQLVSTMFKYGRYLLVSSSRQGSLPANLQGIWNKDFLPTWDSKYTININAQMNYWPSEVTNLSELHEPLFKHIERMVPRGRVVAKRMYGADGWMAHHNTDIWGDCAPQDTCPSSTYWQMGAAWLCLHIFEHYRYTGDREFLKHYINIIKEAARFFEETLIEDENGALVVSPTVSPENVYRLENGESGNLCQGAAMDAQILYELFSGLCETDMISDEENKRYTAILSKLNGVVVEANGTIQEWAKPYEELDPGHRHISHLFALYPGRLIGKDERLMIAARRTLERRLANGGGHTGWSCAWIINMWARICDGDEAYKNIKKLMSESMLLNLFDNHPPFQIDGNFGIVAGIAEMLLQSHNGYIDILPACPRTWKKGKITGIKARGNITLDIEWDGNDISVIADRECDVYYKGNKIRPRIRY